MLEPDRAMRLGRAFSALRVKHSALVRWMWLATVLILSIAAASTTIRRIHRFSYRYDRVDFNSFYRWAAAYESGREVWVKLSDGPPQPGVSHYFCNYTPFFVEASAPMARLDQRTAHLIWEILQAAALAISLFVLARETAPRFDWPATLAFVAIGMVFKTVRNLLWFGQASAFLLLLLVLSWRESRHRHPARAGFWLALAGLLKIYPGVLGGYFILRRKWREAIWSMVIFVAGVVATGISNWSRFAIYGTPHTMERIAWPQMAHEFSSILPNVYRLASYFSAPAAPSWPLIGAITAVLDLIIVAVLAFATLRASTEEDGLVFGMWLAAAVLLSPLAWRHELVLLFPAYLFAYQAAVRIFSSGISYAGLAALVPVIVCLVGEIQGGLPSIGPRVLIPIVLLAACAILVIERRRSRDGAISSRVSSGAAQIV
jgi:hypothetical protein